MYIFNNELSSVSFYSQNTHTHTQRKGFKINYAIMTISDIL